MVLHQHQIDARVMGGIIMPRVVQFQLSGVGLDTLRSLSGELAAVIGSEVDITSRNGHIVIEAQRTDADPIALLPLLGQLSEGGSIPPYTAALGMCDDGAPLLIRLPADNVRHVLILGGNDTFLQSVILSLAMTNRPRTLRMLLVGKSLEPFANLSHASWLVTDHEQDAIARLRLLRDLAVGRRGELFYPRVVIAIDDLNRLDDTACVFLAEIMRDPIGVHVIAAGPGEPKRSMFPAWLIRKSDNQYEAQVGSDRIGFVPATITLAEIEQMMMIRGMSRRQPVLCEQG